MLELLAVHLVATTVLCAVAVLHDPDAEPGELFTLALMWPFLAWAAFVYHLAAGMAWAASKWKGVDA
jgi:hypothetical protein